MLALENIGFDSSVYALNISEEILSLVGIDEKTDMLYQRYLELLENAVNETSYINMDDSTSKWAGIIYTKLIEMKSGDVFLSG